MYNCRILEFIKI